MSRLPVLLVAAAVLGGCAHPLSPARDPWPGVATVSEPPAAQANGALFQPQRGFVSLFEDRRARRVGDIITIVLNEQVSASKNAASDANRTSAGSLEIEQLPDGLDELAKLMLDLSGDQQFSGGGSSRANNTFTGTITVSVQEVLANGNLQVAGEKQIAINSGTEYIRFSGVVNPRTISGQSTVPSTQVADARIHYTGDGYISDAQRMGWLQRFFLNVYPY